MQRLPSPVMPVVAIVTVLFASLLSALDPDAQTTGSGHSPLEIEGFRPGMALADARALAEQRWSEPLLCYSLYYYRRCVLTLIRFTPGGAIGALEIESDSADRVIAVGFRPDDRDPRFAEATRRIWGWWSRLASVTSDSVLKGEQRVVTLAVPGGRYVGRIHYAGHARRGRADAVALAVESVDIPARKQKAARWREGQSRGHYPVPERPPGARHNEVTRTNNAISGIRMAFMKLPSAQRAYHRRHGRYARSITELGSRDLASVVTITSAGGRGWTAVGRSAAWPGRSCVMSWGTVASQPLTLAERRTPARSAGKPDAIACDLP